MHWTNNIISNICRLLYIFILTFVLAVNLLTIGIESIVHGVSGKRNIETSSSTTNSRGKWIIEKSLFTFSIMTNRK